MIEVCEEETASSRGREKVHAPVPGNPWGLSQREMDVMHCIVTTGSNKRAARDLDIAIKAVENDLCSVYQKMGIRSRVLAAIEFALWARSCNNQPH